MSRYPTKQMRNEYQKLPPVLKEAMFSADVAERLLQIGQKSELSTEQIGDIAEETGYLIIGVTEPRNFVLNLITYAHVEEERARRLAGEISRSVLSPLRMALQQANHQVLSEQDIAAPVQAQTHRSADGRGPDADKRGREPTPFVPQQPQRPIASAPQVRPTPPRPQREPQTVEPFMQLPPPPPTPPQSADLRGWEPTPAPRQAAPVAPPPNLPVVPKPMPLALAVNPRTSLDLRSQSADRRGKEMSPAARSSIPTSPLPLPPTPAPQPLELQAATPVSTQPRTQQLADSFPRESASSPRSSALRQIPPPPLPPSMPPRKPTFAEPAPPSLGNIKPPEMQPEPPPVSFPRESASPHPRTVPQAPPAPHPTDPPDPYRESVE